jgi:hypothetical protein
MTPSRSRVRIERIDLDLEYYTLQISMGKRRRCNSQSHNIALHLQRRGDKMAGRVLASTTAPGELAVFAIRRRAAALTIVADRYDY